MGDQNRSTARDTTPTGENLEAEEATGGGDIDPQDFKENKV